MNELFPQAVIKFHRDRFSFEPSNEVSLPKPTEV